MHLSTTQIPFILYIWQEGIKMLESCQELHGVPSPEMKIATQFLGRLFTHFIQRETCEVIKLHSEATD